ncbi:hypothetical protein BZG36_01488 [Bifiguratus adelaidae]|uniref:Histone-binding protein RBBP4 N-terminal domain-containing protein n=1 Tax=Bifiguratus adelaidae TaxID=1938954 RepID=A0A261Y4R1_9FUNG|nr:hypothetical protein BZG36_01488 [Bifiguratus adelaidae]
MAYAYDPVRASDRMPMPAINQEKYTYNYTAPWPVYAMDWSKKKSDGFQIALGSFLEQLSNKLQVISLRGGDNQYQNLGQDFVVTAEADHGYPISKLQWEPARLANKPSDTIATTSDILRLWELTDAEPPSQGGHIPSSSRRLYPNHAKQLKIKTELANNKQTFSAPLTSFDWNEHQPSLIVTSSIDTTCTVWNVETRQAKTQLIAHDREVFDVAFAHGSSDIFASVGADGSVRMFDLRQLEHSTIIYETPAASGKTTSSHHQNQSAAAPSFVSQSLLRLQFNRLEANYLATFQFNSHSVQILDVRVPGVPVTQLFGHADSVNCMSWSPHTAGQIATGADDCQLLLWDMNTAQSKSNNALHGHTQGHHHRHHHSKEAVKPALDPVRAHTAENEINHVSWNYTVPDWLAMASGKTIQALRGDGLK